jgi:phospholipid/cholesterol/gamma-HCH transport system substrate-binding protein
MHLARRIWIQLAIFIVVSITAIGFIAFGYARLPVLLFGIGHYSVTLQLPEAGGLYERANVTYRGTQVGQVEQVRLTDSGVEAELSLRSDVKIPSTLTAEVHSTSAVGEQYVALLPNSAAGPFLKQGDVIRRDDTRVPPDINALLDATNRGLQAIPGDNLKTTIDESYTAFGGLSPEISRFLKGGSALAISARQNLNELTNVVDNAGPLLDTQTETADSVQAWAAHLATVTKQLQNHDADLRGILRTGAPAADQLRELFTRLQPTLPVLLANLATIAPVAITYRADLEQLLVMLPQGAGISQAIGVPNRFGTPGHTGQYLSFNLNLNLPPPCTTGFLPAQQQRVASFEDYPPLPAGDLYCRTPQDSPFNVRGARNIPCETRPGKRAPTVKLCESDQEYVPLNDGLSWKGDPNATLSGQSVPAPRDVPEQRPGTPTPPDAAPAPAAVPPPLAVVQYDPATGTYVGPDGHLYTQSDLAHSNQPQTWQSMLAPRATP